MKPPPTLEDLIGIEYSKLGFFREAQEKIAQLHASKEELERKRQQVQAILDGITDVMAVISPGGRITSVNHVFSEVFGNDPPEGRFCFEVFRGSDRPCHPCPARAARDTNRVCRQEHIFSVAGVKRHFEITASPLRDPQGRPCHILLLKRDVTVERDYQAKFHQAEKMATVGILAAGVAHEINNPLTAINGFAQALKRRLPGIEGFLPEDFKDDLKEYLGIILDECARCQEIVQGLLTFSRQSSGSLTSLDVNGLVRETARLLRHRLKEFPADTLRLDLSDPPAPLQGNPSQIKQLILNLLLNALDAVEEHRGTVTVRTYCDPSAAFCLEVADTGCGITEDNLGKIFDPFFSTKPVGRGSGIGLSTCYNIARSHGAEIQVESREGEGSIFRVVFSEGERP